MLKTPYVELEDIDKQRLYMAFALLMDREVVIFQDWGKSLNGDDRFELYKETVKMTKAGKIIIDLGTKTNYLFTGSNVIKSLYVDDDSQDRYILEI